MKKFLKNILKMFSGNIFSLISGVLVGFLIPKIMGLEDYANYKIYTLYLSYIGLLTLGLGDGLYLKFAGIDKDELDKNQLSYFVHIYYFQLLILSSAGIIVSLFLLPNEYKFIGIALSYMILVSNIESMHLNLSLITSRFNEYSLRTIIKAILTSVSVLVLFLLFYFGSVNISYYIYIICMIVIQTALTLWYMITYRDINFKKCDKSLLPPSTHYYSILLIGFPLLLSNMAGTIFLNMDRQFVSVLFEKTDYAIYAFAYNMLSLVTVATSAVSLVLFPSMRKIKNIDVKSSLEKFTNIFTVLICFCLLVYFPLDYFVFYFLPKYQSSLEIFKIVLPGLIFSSAVSVVFINFFKLENKVNLYFIITIISICISIGLNFAAYYIFKTYQSISWASIVSLIIWYFSCVFYFLKKYHIKFIKNFVYAILIMVSFYFSVFLIDKTWLGMIIYFILFILLSVIFHNFELKTIIESVKNLFKKSKN